MNEQIEVLTLNIPDTDKPRLVIIGGGFGGLATIRNLRKCAFQVVVFDERNYNTFQPLLYQVATAGLQPDAIASPLRKEMWEGADYHFRHLKVLTIDSTTNTLSTIAGKISYDYLIIATGTRANFFGNKQLQQYTLPLKTIPDALNIRSQIMQMLEMATITPPEKQQEFMNIAIVGGGPTGVEMAGALAELRKHVLWRDYPQLDFSKMNIYLLEGGPVLLPAMSAESGAKSLKDLEAMGIIVRLNTLAASCDGQSLTLKDGSTIATRTIVWSAGVKAGIPTGVPDSWIESGRILVDDHCRVPTSPNVFAIGDVALQKSAAFPKGLPGVAQPAMQMGAYLGKNLGKMHENKPVKPFHYFDKGSLATIGRAKAVADFPGNLKFSGRIAWFIWLFIHIAYLVSFRNKLVVFATWCWNFITYEKGNRLIIRPFFRKDDLITSEMTD
jgi:NADH:ubiquinone reductase (H+-translocating)